VAVANDVVTVAMGHLRTRVRADTLVARPGGAAGPAAPSPKARAAQVALPGSARAPSRCDVRGLRLEEAERLLLRALDVCLSEGQQMLWVVHGHGTGQLKEGLRDFLQGSPYVASFRPGDGHEGGEGITVVRLDR
jgi:DNA mismatch repair protein MutS2